jgi:ABC-2 type transport system permease protein
MLAGSALEAAQDAATGALVVSRKRTAEAAGVSGLFAFAGSAGAFAPKTLRSSMGSAVRLPILSDVSGLGTLETLLTTPVTTAEVVLGKFGAAYALYLLLWSATAGFFFILSRFAQNTLFIDAVPLLGGYAFIALSGLLFIAIGILASSFSRNQAIAGLLGFVLLFALVIGTRFLADVGALKLDVMAPLLAAVNYAQVFTHLDDFTRGVVDTRQVIFYFSGTALTLLLGILGIEARQVHS